MNALKTSMTLDDLQELFGNAVQSDLEHGVAWMNDEAATRFGREYPELNKALAVLAGLEGFQIVVLEATMRSALQKMVEAHDTLSSDTEGRYPPLDPGCNDCTQGCTPLTADTGLCPYHRAKSVLRAAQKATEATEAELRG